MRNQLTCLQVKNFRSLADVSVETRPINVFFGPNGSGKSTLFEAIRLVKDCVSRDVEEAASSRSNGLGMLRQGANTSEGISIELDTVLANYVIQLGFSGGQIQPYAGEILYSKEKKVRLISRRIGRDYANFYNHEENALVHTPLTFPEKLALIQYMQGQGHTPLAVFDLRNLLNSVMDSSSYEDSGNLMNILQNKIANDRRYETITNFMRKSFPNFKSSPRSDGELQMLRLLTALFAQENENDGLILFDNPETSLHPYAISVFAEAVKIATKEWNRQVFIATHSPVLISEFDPEDLLATDLDKSGQTVLTRVSEMDDIQDLLKSYATGSLYMAEAIAPQSKLPRRKDN